MKILITGASGLLGSKLSIKASDKGYVVLGIYNTKSPENESIRSIRMDLSNTEDFTKLVHDYKPDWIVHCAAMTDVEECETNPEKANYINSILSGYIAQTCSAIGTRMAYISTDSVFNGNGRNYCENDRTHPINSYAKSKLEGEKQVLTHQHNALIVRTNFFGVGSHSGKSIIEWAFQKLKSNEIIKGYSDVFFSPLYAGTIAEIIIELINRNASGIYHVGSSDKMSKYDFLLRFTELFEFDRSLIHKSSINDSGQKAGRPLNTTLDSGKIQQFIRIYMPCVVNEMKCMKKDNLEYFLKANMAYRGNIQICRN